MKTNKILEASCRFMHKLVLTLALSMCCSLATAKTWHVSPSGSDLNDGSSEKPVRTISHAALYAIAGDTVLIHGGTYRERVSPANTGLNNANRITYMAAEGEEVWLKGSEEITEWKKERNGIWSTTVDNQIFGDFNPFAIKIFGDWLYAGSELHLGEVYLNILVSDKTRIDIFHPNHRYFWR